MASVLGLLISPSSAISQGLDFAPTDLPWAVIEKDYNPPPLAIKGGAHCEPADAVFTAASALPEGLSIRGSGQFEGVPRKTGTYHFRIRVEDSCSSKVREVQLFVTGAPILVVSVKTLEFRYSRGGPPPEPQALLVRGTWPGRAYSIDLHDAAWLRAIPTSGSVPRISGTLDADRVKVTVDSGSLAPGVYDGKLTFWTAQGANAPEVRVRLLIE
jgi:Putative Ig domain